jgi:hypothetical protein
MVSFVWYEYSIAPPEGFWEKRVPLLQLAQALSQFTSFVAVAVVSRGGVYIMKTTVWGWAITLDPCGSFSFAWLKYSYLRLNT